MLNFLDQVKKVRGADAALGIRFVPASVYIPVLPEHSHIIGQADGVFFCNVDGYQDTVFAAAFEPGYGLKICPLAYDFREFIRLILACGSAAAAAGAGMRSREKFQRLLAAEEDKSHSGLYNLGMHFSLTPVADPYEYVQTVLQVIDYSPIRC